MNPGGEKPQPEGAACVIDPKQLGRLIVELNIVRKQIAGYPPGHPVIRDSTQKALSFLGKALENCDRITLGIARDSLWLGEQHLEKRNPVFRDFAQALFAHEIVTLTLFRYVEADELITFNRLLATAPEKLAEQENISQALRDAGITSIVPKLIDYGAFRSSSAEAQPTGTDRRDDASEAFWESFVQGMLKGSIDPASSRSIKPDQMSPEGLADLINEAPLPSTESGSPDYSSAITAFLRQMDQDGIEQHSLERLSRFAAQLSPALRSQFLKGTFGSFEHRPNLAKELLENLPTEILLDTLQQLDRQEDYVPPKVLSLLKSITPSENNRRLVKATSAPLAEEHLGERIRAIFDMQNPDDYLPRDYQQTLQGLTTLPSFSGELSPELRQLRQELEHDSIEQHMGAVLVEIMSAGNRPDELVNFREQLLDVYRHALDTGDFNCLTDCYRRLKQSRPTDGRSEQAKRILTAFFTGPEFIDEILSGLSFWGKQKQSEIEMLISAVGKPFAPPLLERLADENNRTLRNLYMHCLVVIGPVAIPPIIEKLRDERWYFVRNLVVVLRDLRSEKVLPALRRLASHPHPKVRQETLRCFLVLGVEDAAKLLLRELDAPETGRRLDAVRLARGSRSDKVHKKLLEILDSHQSGIDYELRTEVLDTLAELGRKDTLPHLERLLTSRSLLHPILHRRFLEEIMRSLEQYPPHLVRPILQGQSEKASRPLAALAREILAHMENAQQ